MKKILLTLMVFFALILGHGFYILPSEELAIITTLDDQPRDVVQKPGLHWHLPWHVPHFFSHQIQWLLLRSENPEGNFLYPLWWRINNPQVFYTQTREASSDLLIISRAEESLRAHPDGRMLAQALAPLGIEIVHFERIAEPPSFNLEEQARAIAAQEKIRDAAQAQSREILKAARAQAAQVRSEGLAAVIDLYGKKFGNNETLFKLWMRLQDARSGTKK